MQQGLQYISLVISFSWILLLRFHELGLSQKSSDILASLLLTYKLSENSDIMIPHPQDILNATLFMYNDHIFNGGVQLSSLLMQPDEGVIFIKTHKTASTTINGIFWRTLCNSFTTNCFLPDRDRMKGKNWNLTNEFDWNFIVNISHGTLNKNFPYDAWIYHVRYDPRLYEVIPKAKKIFSVIRRPAARFQSAWHWYQLNRDNSMSLSLFTNEVYKYHKEKNILHSTHLQDMFLYHQGLDITSDELMVVNKFHPSISKSFLSLIHQIIQGEMILLITERFDECLVILCKLFNWTDFTKVLYIRQKVQKYNSKNQNTPSISEDDMMLLDYIQPYDKVIYDLGNIMLDRYIATYPGNFDNDLKRLKLGLHRFANYCSENTNSIHCSYMSMDNLKYIIDRSERLKVGLEKSFSQRPYPNITTLSYLFD